MYNHIASNRQRTIILMMTFFIVVVGIGWLFSYIYNDSSILYIAVGISLVMNWIGYFNSDKLALAASGARPIQPERSLEEKKIMNLVENLSITAGIPTPKTYIIEDGSLNAFATGRNPEHASIALTRGLIDNLEKIELEGVIAHELSHVKNYDILLSTVAVTLVGVITLLADWIARTSWSSNNDDSKSRGVLAIIGLVLIILAPLFANLLQLAISRRREFLADASGALLTRYPEGLASALAKLEAQPKPLRSANRATAHLFIVSPFGAKLGKTVGSLFSTHPPIDQRIKALKEMSL